MRIEFTAVSLAAALTATFSCVQSTVTQWEQDLGDDLEAFLLYGLVRRVAKKNSKKKFKKIKKKKKERSLMDCKR